MAKTDKERLSTGFWNRIESNQATDCNNVSIICFGDGDIVRKLLVWRIWGSSKHQWAPVIILCRQRMRMVGRVVGHAEVWTGTNPTKANDSPEIFSGFLEAFIEELLVLG